MTPSGAGTIEVVEAATEEVMGEVPTAPSTTSTGPPPPLGGRSRLSAGTVKRVALELGGKSANLVLDDADLAAAVADGVSRCYVNAGQSCQALTRMLVPRARLPEAEELAAAEATGYTVGDPLHQDTRMGPLVSAAQRERVRHFIRRGVDEGAKVLTGGAEAPEGLERGFYVRPTVLSEVTPDMAVAREEIFGPVLSILAHDGDDHAVHLATPSAASTAGCVRPTRSGRWPWPAPAHRPGLPQRRLLQPRGHPALRGSTANLSNRR